MAYIATPWPEGHTPYQLAWEPYTIQCWLLCRIGFQKVQNVCVGVGSRGALEIGGYDYNYYMIWPMPLPEYIDTFQSEISGSSVQFIRNYIPEGTALYSDIFPFNYSQCI